MPLTVFFPTLPQFWFQGGAPFQAVPPQGGGGGFAVEVALQFFCYFGGF